MSNQFFEKPILNSPYEYPGRHWELDANGQPTQRIVETRRRAEFIAPIPKAKKQKGGKQDALLFDDELSTQKQAYDHTAVINSVRQEVDKWRALENPADWRVTPETARLLQHWRQLPWHGGGRDRLLPTGDRRTHGRHPGRAEHLGPGPVA